MSVISFKPNANLDYSLALKKIEEQDYLFAIKLLKDAIRIDPKEDYYIELAELYYKLNQFEESVSTYIELAKKNLTMEVALAVLHSHQKALNKELDPNELTMPDSIYYKVQNRTISNNHFKKIIKEYQSIALSEQKDDRMINVKKRRLIKDLEEARSLAIEGERTQALVVLDEVEWGDYTLKALELKTLIYLSGGDYYSAYENAENYLKEDKNNINVNRAYLYSIFAYCGKQINAEFIEAFEGVFKAYNNCGNIDGLLSLYELSQMVGYDEGCKKVTDLLSQKYTYDVFALLTVVSYYALEDEWENVDKYLKIANAVCENNPRVNYLNYLRRFVFKTNVSNKAWLSVLDEQLTKPVVEFFVSEYIRGVDCNSDEKDLIKIAMYFLDAESLADFLLNEKIIANENIEELLVWGIENPYIGLENKITLITKYISNYYDKSRIFIIPTELGTMVTRLVGKLDYDIKENDIYNAVYPNVLFTLHDVDTLTLSNAVSLVKEYNSELDKKVIYALVHAVYHKLKKYEPQLELVAGTYKVEYNELKNHFECLNHK